MCDERVAGRLPLYGPNNTGKTCLIKCIRTIKEVFLNKKNRLMPNIFTEDSICELGVTFMASRKNIRMILNTIPKRKSIYMNHFRKFSKISIIMKKKYAG